jgi:hypothetical protein
MLISHYPKLPELAIVPVSAHPHFLYGCSPLPHQGLFRGSEHPFMHLKSNVLGRDGS